MSKINKRLSRSERNVKDEKKVQLYRFEDPILGPRKNPTLENYKTDLQYFERLRDSDEIAVA